MSRIVVSNGDGILATPRIRVDTHVMFAEEVS
jgi:hypothetical protein